MNATVKQFIEAHQKVRELKNQLFEANTESAKASQALTRAYFEREEVPITFVIRHGVHIYLIRIDTEGEHAHTIEEIDAIIEGEVKATATAIWLPGVTCTCGHQNRAHDYGQCDLCECQEFIWVGSK